MTVDEFRVALGELSEEQFRQFREAWGGARATVDETVQEFAYSPNPAQWERIIVFRLAQVGVTSLKTEEEKLVAAALESAVAAKASAAAADGAALSAANSVRWARWSVVVAAIVGVAAAIAAIL
jgi:hypothetical protein